MAEKKDKGAVVLGKRGGLKTVKKHGKKWMREIGRRGGKQSRRGPSSSISKKIKKI